MDSQWPSKPYHGLDGHRITVEEVETVARHQGVEFRRGDVMIIRTGMTEIWEDFTPEILARLQEGKMSGLHGTEETARWLWNKHFTALARDSQACEAFPPLKPDGTVGSVADLCKFSFKEHHLISFS